MDVACRAALSVGGWAPRTLRSLGETPEGRGRIRAQRIYPLGFNMETEDTWQEQEAIIMHQRVLNLYVYIRRF